MQELTDDIDAVLSRIHGKYLNDVLPVPPTAEMLACWILAQLSSYWEWVSIHAYDGFMCKIERRHALAWIEKLRPGVSSSRGAGLLSP
jgi:6-pyruvoyl-tetrahydropterin synthase